MLLRKKAAEELKKEQERKAAERRRIIEERCGKPKNIEDANEGKLTPFTTNKPTNSSLDLFKVNVLFEIVSEIVPIVILMCPHTPQFVKLHSSLIDHTCYNYFISHYR